MSTYDDGEGYCPGDPKLEDLDLKELKKLQKRYDKIDKIKNPIEQADEVKKLMKEMYGG